MKIVNKHKGFKANQLVLDANMTLARIVYIEIDDDLSTKYKRDISYVRLGLINEQGIEFANSSASIDSLTPIPWLRINYKK